MNADGDGFKKTKSEVECEIAHIYNTFEEVVDNDNLFLDSLKRSEFDLINQALPFELYVYENDRLIFWNNNEVPELNANLINTQIGLVSLKNGYYLAQRKEKGDKIFLGLSLIRNSYSLVNEYLSNSYSKQFNFQNNDVVLPALHSSGGDILAPNNEVVFKVERQVRDTKDINFIRLIISILLAMLFFFFLQYNM